MAAASDAAITQEIQVTREGLNRYLIWKKYAVEVNKGSKGESARSTSFSSLHYINRCPRCHPFQGRKLRLLRRPRRRRRLVLLGRPAPSSRNNSSSRRIFTTLDVKVKKKRLKLHTDCSDKTNLVIHISRKKSSPRFPTVVRGGKATVAVGALLTTNRTLADISPDYLGTS